MKRLLSSFYFWAALIAGVLYMDLALLQQQVVRIEVQIRSQE